VKLPGFIFMNCGIIKSGVEFLHILDSVGALSGSLEFVGCRIREKGFNLSPHRKDGVKMWL